MRELDGSVIREARREFTQEVSLHVFSRADEPRRTDVHRYRVSVSARERVTNWRMMSVLDEHDSADGDALRDLDGTHLVPID